MPKPPLNRTPIGGKLDRGTKRVSNLVRVPILESIPGKAQGKNGDIVVAYTSGKPAIFIKVKDQWQYSNLGNITKSYSTSDGLVTSTPSGSAGAYSFDSGWFTVKDSSDSDQLESDGDKSKYRINHRSGCDLVKAEVFCRFEALKDGAVETFIVNLNSHLSHSGPNSSRYGYWINMIDKNNFDLYIHPDGLTILHSEQLKDSSSNTSMLISSKDGSNVGTIELRVIVFPIKSSMGTRPKLTGKTSSVNNESVTNMGTKIFTGNSIIGTGGAAVDGTKNDSFSIDSDGTGVLLKNDSGTLKVRNIGDSADTDVQCANIKDSNGNVVMEINAISGTKTDHIKFTNAITGTGAYPTIEPSGDSSNKSIQIKGRGTGNVYIQTTNSASSVGFQDNTDAVRLVADPENKKFRILGQATKYAELDSDTSGELRIATYDVDNNVTTGHIKLSACDDIYLAAGGDNIYLNGGGDQDDATFDIGTTFGFFDFGTSTTCKLSSANNYDLNLIGLGTGDITLDAGGDIISDAATGIHKFLLAGDADDLCTLTVAANGATTIATADSDGTAGSLTLDVNGGLYIDVDSGAARITSGGSTFTPTHSTDLVTKAYVDSVKHTAVWGGELPRIGGSGTWFGIPTGHSLGALQMGTGSSPDTSYTVSTTADDLVACIWASMHDITVTGCKIWVGQGGATNTAHSVSLMRYEIDSDGDLSNGIEIGSADAINSDDYSSARAQTLVLGGTLDVDFSNNEILIAFVEPTAAYNSYMAAKVILEYTEVET